MAGKTFYGTVTVAARIIDYLSSGLYPNPAACLKELVNNSYDADASLVEIFVKPDANQIMIADDGKGMTREEFVAHFNRISESHKRDSGETTETGRKKIGRIGIGLIAANELCNSMEIFSTKAGSRDLLHVVLDFAAMRRAPDKRKQESGDYVKADYKGEVLDVPTDQHYTNIFLKDVHGEASGILAGATEAARLKKDSLYGLKPQSVAKRLQDRGLQTWKQLDRYSETLLQVGLLTPVPYHDDWMPRETDRKVDDLRDRLDSLGFVVRYDGAELRQPIVFSPGDKRVLLRRFRFAGKNVAADGYFYVQHGTLKPLELNGLLLRIRNVAVGKHDSSFMGFTHVEGALIQKWVSAEIWADDRLEDAMNIDRATLRETHAAYVELRAAVHKEFRRVLKDAREELYEKASGLRKKKKAGETLTTLDEWLHETVRPVSHQAEASIRLAWKQSSASEKQVLKKFAIDEVYDLVFEAARDLVSPAQLAEIMKRLTKGMRVK